MTTANIQRRLETRFLLKQRNGAWFVTYIGVIYARFDLLFQAQQYIQQLLSETRKDNHA